MNRFFYIMIDVEEPQLQKDIVQVLSTMALDSVFLCSNATPGKGFFIAPPCTMFLFKDIPDGMTIHRYKELHAQTYPDAHYIYFGEKFYFYDCSEILEIPTDRFIKYLTRCLLNLYLEFNKKLITEELKEIKDWDLKKRFII